ncbi:unnamed protein product [Rotaria sordida]|uniref:Uncharacterized protein n=2 Tax=Rotaria sordida TaxID=392033 RepID=A0A814I9S6_9BILA|nr:unnamed protein product [Rotaria sordida]CAF1020356.1 unnamed protein product [Rotaria sordida]CAF3828994.1 unnamed protein product [Rotaria sordida]
MIQDSFTMRRNGFETHLGIQSGLDLIDTNGQHTYMLELLCLCDPKNEFIDFKCDEEYEANEDKHKEVEK